MCGKLWKRFWELESEVTVVWDVCESECESVRVECVGEMGLAVRVWRGKRDFGQE